MNTAAAEPTIQALVLKIDFGQHLTKDEVDWINKHTHDSNCPAKQRQVPRSPCTCGYWQLAEYTWAHKPKD